MELSRIRLHKLDLSFKLAVTCLIAVLGGGLIASALHMHEHYRNKDEQPELTLDDVTGSFHGVNQPSRLLEAVDGHMRRYVPTAEEHASLRKWLESDRISEDYDSLELGDFAPAEIIGAHCLRCHAKDAAEGEGIGERIPLDYWEDVKKVAFAKRLNPVPVSILVTSTHTHALTMPLVGIAACALFLATAWPRRIKRLAVMLTFIALFCDIGSWWLARFSAPFTYLIVAGGAVFGLLCGLQLLAAFLDTWLRGFFCKEED